MKALVFMGIPDKKHEVGSLEGRPCSILCVHALNSMKVLV
jgi:hypothetical protein